MGRDRQAGRRQWIGHGNSGNIGEKLKAKVYLMLDFGRWSSVFLNVFIHSPCVPIIYSSTTRKRSLFFHVTL